MPVLMTLSDGTEILASVRLPLSNKLADMLNSNDTFLDIVTAAGEQQFIAKAFIRNVRSSDAPRQSQPEPEVRPFAQAPLDPYALLQIHRDASPDEVKKAYHRMVRQYHPDRIASYDLPDDIMEYARDMLVRINLAFEELSR